MNKSILFIIICLFGCKGRSNDSSDQDEYTSPEPSIPALRTLHHLRTLKCLSPGAHEQLVEAVDDPAKAQESAQSFSEDELCANGRALFLSTLLSPTIPAFEGEARIVFDSGSGPEGPYDACLDSVYDLTTGDVTSYDQDGDGCFDRIWDFTDALEKETDLTPEAKASLTSLVDEVLEAMIPDPATTSLVQNDQKGALLDQIKTTLGASGLAEEQVAKLQGFIDNTRNVVMDIQLCQVPTSGSLTLNSLNTHHEGYPLLGDKGSSGQRYFYFFTNDSHGWIGLEQGHTSYSRGFYKAGYGSGKVSPDIPSSEANAKVPGADKVVDDQYVEKNSTTGSGSASSSGSSSGSGSSSSPGSSSSSGLLGDSGGSSGGSSGSKKNPFGTGYINDDRFQTYSRRLCWEITKEEWDTVANQINTDIADKKKSYNFFTYNCMNWAKEMAGLIGKTIPDHTTWGVSDPKALAKSLSEGKKGNANAIETQRPACGQVVWKNTGKEVIEFVMKATNFHHPGPESIIVVNDGEPNAYDFIFPLEHLTITKFTVGGELLGGDGNMNFDLSVPCGKTLQLSYDGTSLKHDLVDYK